MEAIPDSVTSCILFGLVRLRQASGVVMGKAHHHFSISGTRWAPLPLVLLVAKEVGFRIVGEWESAIIFMELLHCKLILLIPTVW